MAKGITLQELDSSAIVYLVPHLGTTSNNGDAYSITTDVPIDVNQKFTIKFNAVSSTAPTLSINNGTAVPIKKPNGNNTKIYASVYTLFKDGSAFILQGEGGGGNAQPDQVELGVTFTNNVGEQTGTLSKQAFIDQLVTKGVSATMADPFNSLAAKIGQISTDVKIVSGAFSDGFQSTQTVSNLAIKPFAIIIRVVAYSKYNSISQQIVADGLIGAYKVNSTFSTMGSFITKLSTGTTTDLSTSVDFTSVTFSANSVTCTFKGDMYNTNSVTASKYYVIGN